MYCIYLTAVFLHGLASLHKLLEELTVGLQMTRCEDAKVAHHVVRASLVLEFLHKTM